MVSRNTAHANEILRRYLSRWKFRRHAFHRYSTRRKLRQATRVQDKGKDQVLVVSKRREEQRRFSLLPRELIFSILLHIPVTVLHEVARYVCKQWYGIISDPCFVGAHRQMSSTGFLTFLVQSSTQEVCYIEEDTSRLKVTEIQFPFPFRLLGSQNGLVLVKELTNQVLYHVMNLVTKVKVSLPRLKGFKKGVAGFALDSSGRYKVVHVGKNRSLGRLEMRVFTVGVDQAWRSIDLQGLRRVNVKGEGLTSSPCLVAGFMYWLNNSFFGFALDVDTETIYQFYGPRKLPFERGYVKPVNMGTHFGISIMTSDGDVTIFWRLTDVKSNKWDEEAGISFRGLLSRVHNGFRPRTGLGVTCVSYIDGNLWYYFHLVDTGSVLVRYNLPTECFVVSPIKGTSSIGRPYPHVHTLVSPKRLASLRPFGVRMITA